uniref:RRM domain-containing protein n=1 Tax=Sinocyclocheilus grahami TaxID=75366 RepID=A0A672MR47_SINGR
MWAETDSALRKSVIGNIIIKGLSRDINDLALSSTFSRFREILSNRVVCDSNGEPKGYGFIYYATLEAAELVIEKLDGSLLNGYLVSVCHFKTYKEHQAEQKSSSKPPQKKDFSLYVQNMPYSLSSEELGSLFSAFGEVTSATVITKKRRSMGYGFVTYSSLDDAVIATSVMNGYIVGNRPLRVAFSHSNTFLNGMLISSVNIAYFNMLIKTFYFSN